ncbi:unnamed protein product [Cuscuta epithymum]|uniref:Leucine-rich repeat-containing N-terminal plant-type domain-containing protein n=1 Tax=Cuscuta epithymum TaxID=186058 RepID=A0AAV0DRY8_9ASTE|nr:unnamed protein product [Cuscuta epithymum]
MLKVESNCLLFLLGLLSLLHMHGIVGNEEVDALYVMKTALQDPRNVLQSWDHTLVVPCNWFHITCGGVKDLPECDNKVTRIDLGNVGLSGTLVPNLQNLKCLQYLELYGNAITGTMPEEFGNLTNLVSLDLYDNQLTGQIPQTLDKCRNLIFLYVLP